MAHFAVVKDQSRRNNRIPQALHRVYHETTLEQALIDD